VFNQSGPCSTRRRGSFDCFRCESVNVVDQMHAYICISVLLADTEEVCAQHRDHQPAGTLHAPKHPDTDTIRCFKSRQPCTAPKPCSHDLTHRLSSDPTAIVAADFIRVDDLICDPQACILYENHMSLEPTETWRQKSAIDKCTRCSRCRSEGVGKAGQMG
jgi:hypothetical protein